MSRFTFLIPLVAFVAVASADRPPHRPHKPPQEAIDACASAASGAACSFTLPARDGSGSGVTITGTCDTPPDQTVLACKPDHPPPHDGEHHPPPPGD